mmetsp:Transcript_24250/g.56316  ORF Transcript_24250/g.56316 Transcript_24250/m.56316 type:complete len:219 (+) Transcript_24250:58-714(+)
MAYGVPDQARGKNNMLESLQQQDPDIDNIVVYSKFVVAYLLQQDGNNPGWRKANIEGPLYLVHRRVAPRYQLLVKNQFSQNDLYDYLHPDWELDCQKNYVFYKVEDLSKRIRGLWFHDDAERQKIEAALEKVLEEIRSKRSEMDAPPPPAKADHGPSGPALGGVDPGNGNYDKGSLPVPPTEGSVVVTRDSLSTALHALADDDSFLAMVMDKLKLQNI